MNSKQLKVLHKAQEKLALLATQHRALQNPACIHFEELLADLQKLEEIDPAKYDDGKTISLNALKASLDQLLFPYKSRVEEISISLSPERKNITLYILRLFPEEKESYNKNKKFFSENEPDALYTRVKEFIEAHAKEAEANELIAPDVTVELGTPETPAEA